jgi:two-component sensor histidine kinase
MHQVSPQQSKDERHLRPKLRVDGRRVGLESVLITDELARRPTRLPDYEAENHALVSLAQEMANSPQNVLQRVVELAMELCKAHSAGVSLLETQEGQEIFRWSAVAGQFAANLGGSVVRDLSPCGVVLDRDSVLLFGYPERHYDYPVQIDPPIVEALLIPFHFAGKPVGTIWVIAHDKTRQFDAEDARLMQSLGKVASSAYQALRSIDALKGEMTERKQAEQQLAANLDAMMRLQKLGAMFVRVGNLEVILGAIVEAAMAIAGADFGNVQLLDAETSKLQIVAQRGFPQWWIDSWNSVAAGCGSCGAALEGKRVIVENVEESQIFAGTPELEIQLKAGVRACQSTPLVSRSGNMLGMFSTHYKKPSRPDERTLRLLDLLAREAADFIEHLQGQEALRAALVEKETLLKEIHHRVKNNLQMIDSLLRLQADAFPDARLRKVVTDASSRVHVIAEIHQLLYGSADLANVDVPTFVQRLCSNLSSIFVVSSRRVKLKVEAESLDLDLQRAVPLGLILNELVSNAFRHAFSADRTGTIRIQLRNEGGSIVLRVNDDGVGLPEPLPTASLGLQLVRFLTEQLQGKVQFESSCGAHITVRFPSNQTNAVISQPARISRS